MTIAAIAASESSGVIGDDHGNIPWDCPVDMKWFRKRTSGHPIIMGRKTFDSIGRPLPKRKNIVITRREDFQVPGVEVAHTLEDALKFCDEGDTVFICGGAEIYEQYLPVTDIVYHTEIEMTIHDPSGLPKFPELDKFAWIKVYEFEPEQDPMAKPKCKHVIYSRRAHIY